MFKGVLPVAIVVGLWWLGDIVADKLDILQGEWDSLVYGGPLLAIGAVYYYFALRKNRSDLV